MQKIPLILTRPVGSHDAFISRISVDVACKLEFIASPLIEIEALMTDVDLPQESAAIFTSSNGVRFAPPAQGRQAFCIGGATTERARALGWQSVCAGRNVSEMTDFFAAHPPGCQVFHLGGRHVRGDLTGSLRQMGVMAEHVPLYDQKLLPLTPSALAVLRQDRPVIVPLFSPRAATHFATLAPPNRFLHLVTLSAAVAECTTKMLGRATRTAPEPTLDALVACVEKSVQAISLG